MNVYSGWHLTHTGQVPGEPEAARCPVCGKVPDVVTFTCDVCDRDGICFTHQRAERSWHAVGREVLIPESCSECWNREYEKNHAEILTLQRMRRLEVVGAVVLFLLLATIGLLFVSVPVAVAAIVVVAGGLVVLARAYFRVARG
jgi:hypothetical protein